MFRITCCITIIYTVFHSMVAPSIISMEIDSSASADWREWNSYSKIKKDKVKKVLYFRKEHKISFISSLECVNKKLINKWANSQIIPFRSSFLDHHQFPEGFYKKGLFICQSIFPSVHPSDWLVGYNCLIIFFWNLACC